MAKASTSLVPVGSASTAGAFNPQQKFYKSGETNYDNFYQGMFPAPQSTPLPSANDAQIKAIRAVPSNSYAPNYPNLGYSPAGYAQYQASRGLQPNQDFGSLLPPERFPTTRPAPLSNGLFDPAVDPNWGRPSFADLTGFSTTEMDAITRDIPVWGSAAAAAPGVGAAARPPAAVAAPAAAPTIGQILSTALKPKVPVSTRPSPAVHQQLMNQQKSDNPAAAAARAAGKKTYSAGPGSTMPLTSMDGKARRTYGDDQGSRSGLSMASS